MLEFGTEYHPLTTINSIKPSRKPMKTSTALCFALLHFCFTKNLHSAPFSTNIVVGNSFTISWKSTQAVFNDWVGLYREGQDDLDYLERYLVKEGTEMMTFTPPSAGQYELRYVSWSGKRGQTQGTVTVTSVPTPPVIAIERNRNFVGTLTWLSRIGRTYDVYVSPDLKHWECLTSVSGTGEKVLVPIVMVGQASFRLLER